MMSSYLIISGVIWWSLNSRSYPLGNIVAKKADLGLHCRQFIAFSSECITKNDFLISQPKHML